MTIQTMTNSAWAKIFAGLAVAALLSSATTVLYMESTMEAIAEGKIVPTKEGVEKIDQKVEKLKEDFSAFRVENGKQLGEMAGTQKMILQELRSHN